MNHRRFPIVFVIALLSALLPCAGEPVVAPAESPASMATMDAAPMPALPEPVVGAFVGMLGGKLVAAGGVRAVPSAGGLETAEYLDAVYVLSFDAHGLPRRWEKADTKLAVPSAFGTVAEANGSLLLLGGMTGDGPTDVVQAITLADGAATVGISELSPLPCPLVMASAARISRNFNKVYGDTALILVGGMRKDEAGGWVVSDTPYRTVLSVDPAGCHKLLRGVQRFFMQFWSKPEQPQGWQRLDTAYSDYFPAQPLAPDCPTGLVRPLLMVRKDFKTEKQSLFVIGGLAPREDGSLEPSRAVSLYVPGDKSLDGWRRMSVMPEGYIPLSGIPLGAAHIATWGAVHDGAPLRTPVDIARLSSSSMKLFHSVTATWVSLPAADELLPDGGTIVSLARNKMIRYPHGRLAWMGQGEVTGLDADAQILTVNASTLTDGHIHFAQRRFTFWDILVVVLYIGGMLAIGNYFAKREKSTEDFFLGGRKIPWWAAGISIYATGISAISFMAIPAKTFATNWDRVCLGLFPPITTFIAAYVFVPMLRNLRITTMMEYMEMRFNRVIRYISSFLMILAQIGGRMAVTLLLPSIALSAVTGIDVKTCIILMGVLATVYTVMGGISAVIWTDVAQTVVIFGGALLALIVICFHVDGGILGVFREAANPDFQKLTMFNWNFDLTVATVWVFTLWAIGDLFGRLGQESLQRAFSTPDEKSAKMSMVTCAVISVPGTILFYLLGTALFAYYRLHAFEMDPAMEENAVLPFFVVQKLPPGVSGLIIAGLFAAAMSTLDSGMNAVATVITRDYYAVFRKKASERERLKVARWITCVAGALGTAMALYFAEGRGLGNAWDLFSKIMALIGGGFGGVIVLAMLTRRASTASTLIGVFFGSIMVIMLEVKAFNYAFIFFVYGTLSTVVSVTVGYLASFIFPNKKDMTGLTVWTKGPRTAK